MCKNFGISGPANCLPHETFHSEPKRITARYEATHSLVRACLGYQAPSSELTLTYPATHFSSEPTTDNRNGHPNQFVDS